jgi:hypothetical protein
MMMTREALMILVMSISVVVIVPLWVLFAVWLGKKYKGDNEDNDG